MGSVHEVIEAFRKAPSNSERGTKFEELMVRYFQLDPLLSQEYEQVWRWIDWPDRGGKQDTGIDLVARARDTGEYTAIQCKFYEPTHMLAKSDIDSFFTASGKKPFTNRILISTTDRWGRNAEDALEDQTIPVERIGLAEIAESPIDWDVTWPQGELQVGLSEATRHEPRLHQAEAIEAVFDGFSAGHDRGKLIMACGTGKTFTALKIAERVAAENGERRGSCSRCPQSLCCLRRCENGLPSLSSPCEPSPSAQTPRSPVPPKTSARSMSPSPSLPTPNSSLRRWGTANVPKA